MFLFLTALVPITLCTSAKTLTAIDMVTYYTDNSFVLDILKKINVSFKCQLSRFFTTKNYCMLL